MKRLFLISTILIFSLLILTSFVAAIPKDFEVKEVHWAAKGTVNEKPFRLGVMTLTWKDPEFFKHKKHDPKSSVVYLDYDGEKYYANTLFSPMTISEEELKRYMENKIPGGVFFYPLEDFRESQNRIAKYSLYFPMVQPGDIQLDKVLLSWVENVDWKEVEKLKKTGIDLEKYKEYLKQKAQWDIDHPMTYDPETDQWSGSYEGPTPEYVKLREEIESLKLDSQAALEGLFECRIEGISSYYPTCQPTEGSTDYDSRECRLQVDLNKGDMKIESGVDCYNYCFTEYYSNFLSSKKQINQFKSCRIYPVEIEKVTSSRIDFETVPLLNPWRAAP